MFSIFQLIPITILILSLSFDLIYPYHKGVLLKIHPVHICFITARKLVRAYAGKLYGVFIALVCILLHLVPLVIILYSIIRFITPPWNSILYIIFGALTLKVSYSIRLLVETGLKIYRYSISGKWDRVKYWTQLIVRRNVNALDNEHLLSAAIESLAESLVDGIVSPLFYYPFLGVLGPFFQRIVNTLDGAIGYKTPELIEQGWFSAKLDTLLNYIPARLTALYIMLSSIILGYNWKNAWKIYLRDHGKTASLNAGHPMSAMAGVLGVLLEKIDHYRLGNKLKPIEPEDIIKTVKIVVTASILHLIFITLIISFISTLL